MKGMISWFARNDVAANLLLGLIFFCGVYTLLERMILEVFPSFEQNVVNISIAYRGASPAEVEEGIVVRVEEAIQDLVGIEEINSTAREGAATVSVEIAPEYDPRELLNDIKNRVDGISTFPQDIERPSFHISEHRREVISVVVAGDIGEKNMRELGRRVQDELTALPDVTQVVLSEIRPYEVAIEVPDATLKRYNLTFAEIGAAIRNSSLDLPAGAIKTRGGEVLLRTKGQAYDKKDFEAIVLRSSEDGRRLTIGDIAEVNDGFEEEPLVAKFNGKTCVVLEVYRVGEQNAITLADQVKDYIEQANSRMPPGVELSYWRDRSRIVKARLKTLVNSAWQGGVLVFLLLTLFLRFSVAIWVCVGIPISFMGAIALMPFMGVTVNIISLFAFILVLGVVVDDAIVTGENIYGKLGLIKNAEEAAIVGTQEVAVPVTFGVLTTVVAFLPLMMIEGHRGPIFAQIPMIVIPVLIFSLVESKLILPAHLKHLKVYGATGKPNLFSRMQQKVADGLVFCIHNFYQPVLRFALHNRYVVGTFFVAIAMVFVGIVGGGKVRYTFFPRVQSETARAYLSMPIGTPFELTASYVDRINTAAEKLREKYQDPVLGQSIIKDILATSGSSGGQKGQSHLGRVTFEIVSPEDRSLTVTSSELVGEWRKMIGPLPGVSELNFRAEIGRSSNPIEVRLAGQDFAALTGAAEELKTKLAEYPAIFDVGDSFQEGKEEIQLKVKPQAEFLGLSMADLASQVRDAFYGREVQRIQRGRDDVRVLVRYPADERRSLASLETMKLRTGEGAEVPFADAAEARLGRSYASINRIDRQRIVNVFADADKERADLTAINTDLEQYLPQMLLKYPGVYFSMEGESREQSDAFGSLRVGGFFLLFAIYGLLAVPFRSYIQPIVVMSVIPFGLVGAILGHIIMNMSMSIFSIFGMLALSGVVVNDSLVMVDFINRRVREGLPVLDAVRTAGVDRFRPILLTSLTTFAGLIPIIFEKSTQAQFLIPMAVSLGFGVLFATFVTLILVPINYLVMEDIKKAFRIAYGWLF